MAKRMTEIFIEHVPGGWYVYVDEKYDAEIAKVPGIRAAVRNPSLPGVLVVLQDPRYDIDELEREVKELCR